MNVVALIDFHDNLRGIDRKAGEQFVVSAERFDEINRIGMEKISQPIVEEVQRIEQPKETPESRAKKAPARRRQKKAE